MTPAPTQGQLPLFNHPSTATPATTSLKEPPPEIPTEVPARSRTSKPTCADCGEELKPADSGKLWHTETETRLPSRGKTYLVPCPVTGSKDQGYADSTRSS